ncbi:hypothetical protein BDY21DRAFT_9938 [Lineolata rhizophorae]|uniref:Uncharacterized protein n=1 Tax=Lineolata rhizophorae TaxID=578093 RepID=A0A6A6PE34_9PEZI|nr:hypothetical protein BDY21DRAFT_9938 [Lineolata rhizophorae]
MALGPRSGYDIGGWDPLDAAAGPRSGQSSLPLPASSHQSQNTSPETHHCRHQTVQRIRSRGRTRNCSALPCPPLTRAVCGRKLGPSTPYQARLLPGSGSFSFLLTSFGRSRANRFFR